jgi:hypothetical protein
VTELPRSTPPPRTVAILKPRSPTTVATFFFKILFTIIRPSLFHKLFKARNLIPLSLDRLPNYFLHHSLLCCQLNFSSSSCLVAYCHSILLRSKESQNTYPMPPQLLPASAAAFAPRASSVNVVLGSKVEPWLTQTLKRINRVKRPLNSVPQHQRCLTETLSSPSAIWTVSSLMLPKAPKSELRKDENPLVEALFNYQLLHIEAYIVHIDMVLRNEVAFKFTPDSIEALVEYHKEIYSVDIAAETYDWSEKEMQVKKLHDEFIQSINKFVYRTHVTALEGLEEGGAGELLCGKSEEVKNAILGMFLPLLPPPPRIVDVIRQPPLLPSSPSNTSWWSQATLPAPVPAPVDSWRMLPSSPNTTSMDSNATLWASVATQEMQLPSPTPTYSQPYSTAGMFYSAPQVSAPIPQLPLPSLLAQQQCGTTAYGGFGWDRYPSYTLDAMTM